MTAAVLYGSEDLRIEQIEVPTLAADEVLLRVRLALTDGTDLKVWKTRIPRQDDPAPRRVWPRSGGRNCGHGEARGREDGGWGRG